MTGRPPPPDVAAAFAAVPDDVCLRLLEIRGLIFATAAGLEGVGLLTETLEWGEPAYRTEATGTGSTIRLGWNRSADHDCAVLFNCRTTLIESFRDRFSELLAYQGNRAILLRASETLPVAQLSVCLAMALTYHRRAGGGAATLRSRR